MFKKLLIAFVLIHASVSAQQLPNSGFEDFTNDNPDNWQGYDSFLSSMGTLGTTFDTQVSPGVTGSYAIQLRSQNMGAPYNTAGTIFTGTMVYQPPVQAYGIPYTFQPTSYSFYYKYSPVGGDTANSELLLTRWNTTTASREILCHEIVYMSDTVSSFTLLTVSLSYIMPGTPDTLMLFFRSSQENNVHINSTLIIDDVYMDVPVGLKTNETEKPTTIVYPNPSSEEVTFCIRSARASGIILYNSAGDIVGEFSVTNTIISINLKEYSERIYFYRILDNDKTQVDSGKITISR